MAGSKPVAIRTFLGEVATLQYVVYLEGFCGVHHLRIGGPCLMTIVLNKLNP